MKNQIVTFALVIGLVAGCGKKSKGSNESAQLSALKTALEEKEKENAQYAARIKSMSSNTPQSSEADAKKIADLTAQVTQLSAEIETLKKQKGGDPAALQKAQNDLKAAQEEIANLKKTCNTAEGCKGQTDALTAKIKDLEKQLNDCKNAPNPTGGTGATVTQVTGKLPTGYDVARSLNSGWTENVMRVSLQAAVQTADTGHTIAFLKNPTTNRVTWTKPDGTAITGTDREKYSNEFTNPTLKFDSETNQVVRLVLEGDALVLDQTPVTAQAIGTLVAHLEGDAETQATFLFPPHQFLIQEASAAAPAPDAVPTLATTNRWAYDAAKTYAIYYKGAAIQDVVPSKKVQCNLLDAQGQNPVALTFEDIQDSSWRKGTYTPPLAAAFVPTFISCKGQGVLRQKTGETKDPATIVFDIEVGARFRP